MVVRWRDVPPLMRDWVTDAQTLRVDEYRATRYKRA